MSEFNNGSLDIEIKEDHPQRAKELAAIDSKYQIKSSEFNKLVKAAEELQATKASKEEVEAAKNGEKPFDTLADANTYFAANPPLTDTYFIVLKSTGGTDAGHWIRRAADNTNDFDRPFTVEVAEALDATATNDKAAGAKATFDSIKAESENRNLAIAEEKTAREEATKNISDNDGDGLYVTDKNGKILGKIDAYGLSAVNILNIYEKGFYVVANDGKILGQITNEGISAHTADFKKYKNLAPNNWLYGKTIWAIGDSLSPGAMQQLIADQHGANYDAEKNRLVQQGGTQTIESVLYDRSGFTRARNLKKLNDTDPVAYPVDVIFIECTNDAGSRLGSWEEEPYFESQVLINDTNVAPDYNNLRAYVDANLSTLLANADLLDYNIDTKSWGRSSSFTPKKHTILYLKATKSDLQSYTLVLTQAPTSAGTITINGLGVAVDGTETINEVYEKILEYSYTDIIDEYVDNEDFSQGLIFTDNRGNDFDLTIDYGVTGAAGTLTEGTGGNLFRKYVYKSIDTSNWNTASYWVDRDTEYQPEYGNPVAFGPSLFQRNKGLLEYLQSTFPEAVLIWWLPTSTRFPFGDIEAAKADPSWSNYFYPNGDFNFAEYWSDFAPNWPDLETSGETVCSRYGVRYINMRKSAGITLFNGDTYYNNNDIHPKQIGYQRWADAMSREILFN